MGEVGLPPRRPSVSKSDCRQPRLVHHSPLNAVKELGHHRAMLGQTVLRRSERSVSPHEPKQEVLSVPDGEKSLLQSHCLPMW